MNIYVSNLSFTMQDEDLKGFFTGFGDVTSAKIITDRFSGKSRGFGFVDMPDDIAANKAITELNKTTVDNRTINVVEARIRVEKPAQSSNFRNDSSSYNKERW